MNTLRLLTFEINNTCNNWVEHKNRCPISHPERYKFSTSNIVIGDKIILDFWRFCRTRGFRGMILWHMYNEPVLVLNRILSLMKKMKEEDPFQPFQLTTSIPGDYPEFDNVKISDYEGGLQLDNRIETNTGEGKPYKDMPRHGLCGRGRAWEIPIDYFGNWCLCCGDWRCEESFGNIYDNDWETLYQKWEKKRKTIQWHDEESYNALPRLCRACFDKNPSLSWKGGI